MLMESGEHDGRPNVALATDIMAGGEARGDGSSIVAQQVARCHYFMVAVDESSQILSEAE